jgi:hypothetical protein
MRVLLVLAVCLLGLPVGCGGGDEGGGSSTEAKRAIEASDQQRAEAAEIKLGDLPDGWPGSPHEDTQSAVANPEGSLVSGARSLI